MEKTAFLQEHAELGRKADLFWDAYGLESPGSGIFQYANSLQRALGNYGVTPTLVYLDYRPPHSQLSLPRLAVPIAKALRPFYRAKILWPQKIGERLLTRKAGQKAAILHGLSNFNLPRFSSFYRQFKTVLTIHDLIPFLPENDVSLAYKWQLAFCLRRVLPRVDVILCDSEWTKKTVDEFFPDAKTKTRVLTVGYQSFQEAESRSPSGKQISLLSVARFERYKKLDDLVAIMRNAPDHLVLTLVTDENGARFFKETASDLVERKKLRLCSGLTADELRKAYEAAHVYVHPSLYEGFGLPAAEAMSYALPVVYRTGSALDEVCGTEIGFPVARAASAADWLAAIERAAACGAESGFRSKVRHFLATKPTWEIAAGRLLAVYASLVKEL